MDSLPMVTETTNYVEYYDLEKFVKERYGHKIEIAAMEECSNDSTLSYFVSHGAVTEEEFQQHAAWIMDGRFWPYGTGYILNQLCTDGYIQSGNYIINVSW